MTTKGEWVLPVKTYDSRQVSVVTLIITFIDVNDDYNVLSSICRRAQEK